MAMPPFLRRAPVEGCRTFARISPRTVGFHRANIMQKLGAKNTVDSCARCSRTMAAELCALGGLASVPISSLQQTGKRQQDGGERQRIGDEPPSNCLGCARG